MHPEKLLEKALNSPQNLRFAELLKLAEAFGFEVARTRGSHYVLKRAGVPELLNFQKIGSGAKPYQVKQMLEIVESYNLNLRR
jgi:hypothetical protein